MPPHTPISTLLSPLLQSFRSLSLSTTPAATLLPKIATASLLSSRAFSTSRAKQQGDPRRRQKNTTDPRVRLIRYHIKHPRVPRPLKLSRNRSLRHWTIHRAWMLFRRSKLQAEENELLRMYQSMQSACEALRTMDPVGSKNAGRLYRIALEKKGVFGHEGVPIEYARFQTDTPGKEPWNHGWTR